MKLLRVIITFACAATWSAGAASQELVGPAVLPPPVQSLPPEEASPSGDAPPAYGDLESLLPPLADPPPAQPPLDEPLAPGALEAAITPTPHWYHPNYW